MEDETVDPDVAKDGPETEVWNHLYSGLDLATWELDALKPEVRSVVEVFGQRIAEARKTLVLGSDQEGWSKMCEELLRNAWFRHAAELLIAEDGINRASEALARFLLLKPLAIGFTLSQDATSYLRETIDTFLFGFDAASIALCGATIEQVLRDVLITRQIVTRQELRRDRISALGLLERADRHGLLPRAVYDAAYKSLKMRNLFMHQHMDRSESLRDLALRSMADLGQVLTALGNSEPLAKLAASSVATETYDESGNHEMEELVRERLLSGDDPTQIARSLIREVLPDALDIMISRRIAAGKGRQN